MKKLVREPLLHFVVLGAAIFVAYGFVSSRTGGEPGTIVITQGQVASMVEGFTRTWQRLPTAEELQGLVRDRVRDEVYCREAIALGLDKDDTVIRRRLRQKMQFLSDDIAAQRQPTDAELDAYRQAHPDSFRIEPRFTFRQVYLNPEMHGENLPRDVARLLAELSQADGKSDSSALGDSFLLENQFAAVPASEVARQFGETFATKLAGLTPGQWQGPVESGYGVHLVFLGERTEGRLAALAEVRDAVLRDWSNAQRIEANEKLYEAMLHHYVVTIEPLQGAEETKLAQARPK